MTKDKDEKAVIRARMARTGESYAAARAQLAGKAEKPNVAESIQIGRTDESLVVQLVSGLVSASGVEGPPSGPSQDDKHRGRGVFERFTDRARQVIVGSQEESRELGHNWIGTEHVLLGLLQVDGIGARVLAAHGVEPADMRAKVLDIVGHGEEPPGTHIPFTPRAKKVLEMSLRAALDLNHNYIGTEHLLLGLMREEEGVAAQLLSAAGLTEVLIRADVLEILAKLVQPKEDDPA